MEFDFIFKAITLIILLIFISYNVFSQKSRNHDSIRNLLIWLLILITLILIYAFRFELKGIKDRFLSVIITNYQFESNQGELVIARNQDGHFYLNGYTQNNQIINFLVDTGASDIALTQSDAKKLNIDLRQLKYTKKYQTANGVVFSAPIIIKQLRIGNKIFHNIKASVSAKDNNLSKSLLGMSLVEKFSYFRLQNDFLILGY